MAEELGAYATLLSTPSPFVFGYGRARWLRSSPEVGRTLLAQRGSAFGHVGTHEREHLVGGRLVEDRPRCPEPAVERTLGEPDCQLRSGREDVGNSQRLAEHLFARKYLADQADPFRLHAVDHLARQQVVAGLRHTA